MSSLAFVLSYIPPTNFHKLFSLRYTWVAFCKDHYFTTLWSPSFVSMLFTDSIYFTTWRKRFCLSERFFSYDAQNVQNTIKTPRWIGLRSNGNNFDKKGETFFICSKINWTIGWTAFKYKGKGRKRGAKESWIDK